MSTEDERVDQNKHNQDEPPEELRIPRLYSKIAKHYLKIKRLAEDELLSIVNAIDNINIFYDGKTSVTIRGSEGSYIGDREKRQVNWKKFVIEKIVEERGEKNIKPRRYRRIRKEKRVFRRKRL